MPDATALMISTDAALVDSVKGIARSIKNFRLQVGASIDDAQASIDDSVALVLLHLARHSDEEEATQFIWSVAKANPSCVTLVLSDEYRNHQAVAMLRAGATDYFGLPQDLSKLAYLFDVLTIRARFGILPNTPPATRASSQNGQDPFFFVLAPEMVEMMEQVRRVVNQDTTLLLTGETGTGKTRLARLIHELSPRRDKPFLVVDCGALSANLIESEMFGHARGAFTGADRDRQGKFSAVGDGTLLLDEINALPLHLQSKLLRAVDERVFEPVGLNKVQPLQARIIAVSNTRLDDEVRAGRFRADLYYRLNVVGFYLPPLRERVAAIPPLANKFLAEFSLKAGQDLKGVAPEALQLLTKYNWPGNIRELRNVMERAVTLSPGPEISLGDLPEAIRAAEPQPRQDSWMVVHPNGQASPPVPLSQAREEAELVRITEALLKHGNNRLRAAAELGISRMALYKKLHKYGLIDSA